MLQETEPSGRTGYAYFLCGWRTRSDIPLTAIPTSLDNNGEPEVTIQIATGRSPLGQHRVRFVIQHSEEYSVIGVRNVADFEIKGGRQISVWPAPTAW